MTRLVPRLCLLLFAVVFFLGFSFSASYIDYALVSHVLLMSVAPPAKGSDSMLVVLAVFAILVGAAMAVLLRRHIKVVVAAVAIVVVVIAGVGAVS